MNEYVAQAKEFLKNCNATLQAAFDANKEKKINENKI